jgi:Domain of unknown function DUF29
MQTLDPTPGKHEADYDVDFFAWTQRMAALLRSGRFDELDVEHLAEEVEDMGKRERRELGSRIVVLVAHLLKWRQQPERRTPSWKATIVTQRSEIADLLDDNPSLRPEVARQVTRRWAVAVENAAAKTGLAADVFPASCPWSGEQILDDAFYPRGLLGDVTGPPNKSG